MMDYYSNYEGPRRDVAIRLLEEKITYENKPQWLKKFVEFYVDKEISTYGGLGSLTGWSMMTEPSIWKKLLYKENIYNKQQKWWKKLFYRMRIYNVFMKIYIDVYYKPNGNYMDQIKNKHKSHFY